jgi:hypothetical protein
MNMSHANTFRHEYIFVSVFTHACIIERKVMEKGGEKGIDARLYNSKYGCQLTPIYLGLKALLLLVGCQLTYLSYKKTL